MTMNQTCGRSVANKFRDGCPGCHKKWMHSDRVVIEQYETYDQLHYVCKRCGLKTKIGFRHEPDRPNNYYPRCLWTDGEVEQ